MLYRSTRGDREWINSAQAVLHGLAPDGGLYMPVEFPDFDWKTCLNGNSRQMATAILSALLPDIPNMQELVRRAYTGKFQTEELTPTVQVGDFTVLELFHGPTSAFKDVALSMLPQLLTAAKTATGMETDIMILTATSGDTGKAALVGFQDVPGVKITVFYPEGGVSAVQRWQMVTQEGKNVQVCGVRGNFDDAQTGVKRIFASVEKKQLPYRLSSANSINIGRLAPQIMYYFKAYRDLLDRGVIRLGDPVNFSVPTGNFGDILAGYLAGRLGLPVGRLICASNANNVLTDFIRTGIYDRRRELRKTQSPSMDILVSSNLERLLYLLSNGDTALVADLMEKLERQGWYSISPEMKKALNSQFWAEYATDGICTQTIHSVWTQYGYLCDPHTACGWYAAESYVNQTGDLRPMVVLSTASPYKFPGAVLYALGDGFDGDEFAQMNRLAQVTKGVMPENLKMLKEKKQRHFDVIDKAQMSEYVLGERT